MCAVFTVAQENKTLLKFLFSTWLDHPIIYLCFYVHLLRYVYHFVKGNTIWCTISTVLNILSKNAFMSSCQWIKYRKIICNTLQLSLFFSLCEHVFVLTFLDNFQGSTTDRNSKEKIYIYKHERSWKLSDAGLMSMCFWMVVYWCNLKVCIITSYTMEQWISPVGRIYTPNHNMT